MARRREVPEAESSFPDPKYHDRLVTKFINALMKQGKKSTAERICYGAFEILAEKGEGEEAAGRSSRRPSRTSKPRIEVKSPGASAVRHFSGADRGSSRSARTSLGMRWLITLAHKSAVSGAMREKLAAEISGRRRPVAVPRSRSAKRPIRWPTPTRRSRIFGGSPNAVGEDH